MYRTYSIRSDLDKLLKSKRTSHATLINTLKGSTTKDNKTEDKKDLLEWLSENPECISLFKKWLNNNDGKPVLDTINGIVSGSANSNENKEDQKFYRAWANVDDEGAISSKEFNAFKTMVTDKFKSLQLKNDDQDKRMADQGNQIQLLERDLLAKKREIKKLAKQIIDLVEKLKSANADKAKLEEELKKCRNENKLLRDKVSELEKDLKSVKDDRDKAVEALRLENKKNVIAGTSKRLTEEYNAEAMNMEALEEASEEISETSLTDRCCSSSSDYMKSSDDADVNISLSQND